jgi:hypothetical protein
MNNNIGNTPKVPSVAASNATGGGVPSIVDLFRGDDKYIAGLLITLANLIGFINHFRKARYNKYVTYMILLVLILVATLVA